MNASMVVVAAVAIIAILALVLLGSGQKNITGQAHVICLLGDEEGDFEYETNCEDGDHDNCCERIALKLGAIHYGTMFPDTPPRG